MPDGDIIALHQLTCRCAAAVERNDVESFLNAFTPQARLRSYYPNEDEPFADLVGHDQLATIPGALQNLFKRVVHMLSNHDFEVDGDGLAATGTLLSTARYLSGDPDARAALTVFLRYFDHYEKREGTWRIADRRMHFLWSERHEVVDSHSAAAR